MAEQIGVVQSAIGVVVAKDSISGETRILDVGSPVYRNETIQTMDSATILIEFADGESISLGRMTEVTLTEDILPSGVMHQSETSVDAAMLDAILNNAEFNLDDADLDAVDATASGDEESSANEGGVVIARIGLEGEVNSGFATDGLGNQNSVFAPTELILSIEELPPLLPVINSAPQALIIEDGSTLLSLIGANKSLFDGVNVIGGVHNSAIELGVLDLLNFQPNKLFLVHDKEDNISEVTLTIDNGVGQDLLGLSHILGHQEFSISQRLPGIDYQLSKNGQELTIRTKSGTVMSDEIANLAIFGVDIIDSSTLGTLLNSSLILGASYGLHVIDSEGESASAISSQFLDLNLLQNQTNSGLSDLLDIPVLSALQPVTDLLDQLLGDVDDRLLQTVLDVVDTVDIVTDPLDPVGSLLNGLLLEIGAVVGGLSGSLGASFLGDTTIGSAGDNLVEDIVAALLQIPGMEMSDARGLLQSLLGGDPYADPATQGTLDQLLNGVTNLVDGVLGTETQDVDDGINLVTTDLQELLTNDQSLSDLLTSLLGGNPSEATAGSLDQLLSAITDTVDQITASNNIGLQLSGLDDSVNGVTTDVEQLLTGEENVSQTLQDILGRGDAQQGGSLDQLFADLTDSLDGLLGADTEELDLVVNEITTLVSDLLVDVTDSVGLSMNLDAQLVGLNLTAANNENLLQNLSEVIG